MAAALIYSPPDYATEKDDTTTQKPTSDSKAKIAISLEWPVRYKIVIGIAGITDFGLAKWLPKQWTHHYVIPIEGTFGYLAPEYFMHGIVDEKTDVFAFGVLLLEIITGRRHIDMSKQSLMFWAKPLIESVNIEALADSKLESNYDVDEMRRLVLTASYCIRQSSLWRPSMNEVKDFFLYNDSLL
ncbi:hypothetical protein IFM89_020047 [Coptis chinensis]|uniref:Protein kinase domain-containing protein n=1 Tax=Coptis chinensis TaxID=261450 RepID=A0A835MAA8_9MAGN|nr:hypothetical protein IFM89_020047 [Coptis chinensis]